jgi:uncharacterized protein (DUF1684 family)
MTKLVAILLAGIALAVAAGYPDEILEWRKKRDAALRTPDGWTSLAGLFWLREGANRFGKDAANDIALADGPAQAGVFELHGGQVTVAMDGQTRALQPDSKGGTVTVGRLSLLVIKRGERYGIRLKDPQSPYRTGFRGIEYFPIGEAYRVTARWVLAPKQLPILNILGQTEPSENPGYAVFRLHGQELRLYPIIEVPGDKQLFYIFRDLTTGKETYPAGRFFYSEMPKDGEVVLDFNKAYNPPCAFTPYATCPLPPKENYLQVRIEAGEKTYHTEEHR